MKILNSIPVICLAFLLTVAGGMSQTSGESDQLKRRVIVHATSGAGGSMHITAETVDDTMIGIKAVKGAPYSAETRSETVQSLANGNRIVRRTSTRIYRDSEGRTRQEYTFNSPGDAGSLDMVSINDPVAGVSYSLHPGSKSAEKITHSSDLMSWTDTAEGTTPLHPGDSHVFIRKVPGPDPMPQALPHSTLGRDVLIRIPEAEHYKQAFTSESLGVQVMEGLQVEGKRTTTTMPAGAIGNEQPLVTVTETWFSPDLQTIIYSKRDDPMAGTTIFQVTKLVRGEPEASLFQLPSGYTVNEAKVNVIRKVMEKVPKR